MLNLKIPIKDNNPFLITLKSISFIPPYSKLSNRELEILAELFYINKTLEYIPQEKRMKLIFEADTRNQLIEQFGISPDNLYNIMASLRRKGLVDKDDFNWKYVITDAEGVTLKYI